MNTEKWIDTEIWIAMADIGGDQGNSWYSFNQPSQKFVPVGSPKYGVSKGIDGNGIMYLSEKEGGTLIYRSNDKINGYSGYLVAAPLNEMGSGKSRSSAADYIFSSPQWINDGMTTKTIPRSWAKLDVPRTSVLTDKKDIVAYTVDKLLTEQSKDNDKRTALGLVGGDINALRAFMYVVLARCLPPEISNRISYNTNASASVDGIDIFCTTRDKDSYNGKNVEIIDISKEKEGYKDYAFKNAYARYIFEGWIPTREIRKKSKISELNGFAAGKLLEKLCKDVAKIDIAEKLPDIESYLDICCGDLPSSVRTALACIACRAHFSSDYFKLSDQDRKHLAGYLEYDREVDADKVTGFVNFDFIGRDKIGQERLNGYISFLGSCCGQNVNIYAAIKEKIEEFYYGNFDIKNKYTEGQLAVFKYYFSLLTEKELRTYISEAYSKLRAKVSECNFLCGVLRERFVRLDQKINFILSDREASGIASADWLLRSGFIEGDIYDFGRLETVYDKLSGYFSEYGSDDFKKLLHASFEKLLDVIDFDSSSAESLLAKGVKIESLKVLADKIGYSNDKFKARINELEAPPPQLENEAVKAQIERADVKGDKLSRIKKEFDVRYDTFVDDLPVSVGRRADEKRKLKRWRIKCNRSRGANMLRVRIRRHRGVIGAITLALFALAASVLFIWLADKLFNIFLRPTVGEWFIGRYFNYMLVLLGAMFAAAWIGTVIYVFIKAEREAKIIPYSGSMKVRLVFKEGVFWAISAAVAWLIIVSLFIMFSYLVL